MTDRRLPLGAIALLFLLLAASCGGGRSGGAVSEGEADSMRYATNLAIVRHDGWIEVRLRNPWDTAAVLHTYLLVPADADLPNALPEGTLVRTPLRRAGVATAVACGLIAELGCADAIAGVCEQEYIHQPDVQQGLRSGRVADFGNGMNPDIERIMATAPDALLLTPFEHSGGYGRAERLGIPIIECAEYMETSALGRAEWMRFYALLFGAEARGDSIFAAVERHYLALRDSVAAHCSAATAAALPSLLTETMYGGQWFVPCAQSTMGRMLADAGAANPFAYIAGSGSKGLAFEEVLERAGQADVWLVKYNQSAPVGYTSLARDYRPYTQFRAWRERHIWACNLDATHFYEETPFHPDRLLRDLVIILHPELMQDRRTRYYLPLTE
ncbi:MAG: ABC transporter substrate-binding protein [Bacteroidaceae bacterium]|nr:ABC transporter substrate-binding protein [Bacteroidaceae bacterium]